MNIYISVSRREESIGDGITRSFAALRCDHDRISAILSLPACDTITKVFFSGGIGQSRRENGDSASPVLKSINPLSGVSADFFLKGALRAMDYTPKPNFATGDAESDARERCRARGSAAS